MKALTEAYMQLVRDHILNEEFIEEIKPEDITQTSVDVNEDEPVYRFVLDVTFTYRRIANDSQLLPKLFNKLY